MAGASFRLSFDGQPLRVVADRLGTRFHPRDWLVRVGERWKAWMRDNWQARGLEEPWAPIDPDTVAQKRAGGGPLEGRTGRLARSVANPAVRIRSNGLEVKPRAPHAHLHHLGVRPHKVGAAGTGAAVRATKPFMVFRLASGQTVFARTVNHPGIRPRRLVPSLPLAQELAEEELEAHLRQVTRQAQQA